MIILKKLAITLSTICVFLYMSYILIEQQTIINDYESEIARLERENQEQELKIEENNNTLATISGDEFIAEYASEKLNLVKSNEMIIVDTSIYPKK